MESHQWHSETLHLIADLIYTMINGSDNERKTAEIDAAMKTATIHPIDAIEGLDLHRIVNDFAEEFGRKPKPIVHLPTEMAFTRGKTSKQCAKSRRDFTTTIRQLEPQPSPLQRSIDMLMNQVRYRLKIGAAKIKESNIAAAEERTEMINGIEQIFNEFMKEAKQTGIENRSAKRLTPTNQTQNQTQSTPAKSVKAPSQSTAVTSPHYPMSPEQPGPKRFKSEEQIKLPPAETAETISIDMLREMLRQSSGMNVCDEPQNEPEPSQ